VSSNGTSSNNNNATTMTQGGQDTSPATGNMTSDIDQLEANLLQLKDDINAKATPNEVMMTVHLNIHPLLMQSYGLTLEQEGEEEEHDSDHDEG
jgi:hypothetical protein